MKIRINRMVKSGTAWLWCIDVYFYAFAFPIIQSVVNRQLEVFLYAMPNLIICTFGGILNLTITEKNTMRYLYDRWFLQIALCDAFVWIAYFILWIAEIIPDTFYPICSAIMHVTTVEISKATRNELKNRMFPESDDRTEFENACAILSNLFNSFACITIILLCVNNFMLAKCLLLFALVIDNALFILIWNRFENSQKVSRNHG